MHASTQERFKHCVPQQPTIDIFHPPYPRHRMPGQPVATGSDTEIPTSNCRINITFRFYRPDFAASKTPRCKCGVPCILRPDMKGRIDRREDESRNDSGSARNANNTGQDKNKSDYDIKYWWTCYGGVQNEGKGCGMWKVMDIKAEGRGPFVGNVDL